MNDSEVAAGAALAERPERLVELGVVQPREREEDRGGVLEAVDVGEVDGDRTVVEVGGVLEEGAADGVGVKGGAPAAGEPSESSSGRTTWRGF